VLADNQAASAAAVAQSGCMESIGFWKPEHSSRELGHVVGALAADASRRRTMSAQARRLVDGQGAGRIVERLLATTDQRAEVVA
jgi:spore coat polysaccharide biosynthesis predicted glycosyltransferase SpsG